MSTAWGAIGEAAGCRRRARTGVWAVVVLVVVLFCWPVLRCPRCRRQVWGWDYASHVGGCGPHAQRLAQLAAEVEAREGDFDGR